MDRTLESQAVCERREQAGAFPEWRIRQPLEMHSHFRGRTSAIALEVHGETVIVTGCLPSFYLKQLLQEALKGLPGITRVENRVEVGWPNGVSPWL